MLEHATMIEERLETEWVKSISAFSKSTHVRNSSEVKERGPFEKAFLCHFAQLRNRIDEIATNKPIVVQCAPGYRSVAASSMIKSLIKKNVKVFDFGVRLKDFRG